MMSSEACTRGIRVKVKSQYVPEHSLPEQDKWFFTYTIQIQNETDSTVKLLSRHWIITDANGNKEEVTGDGVVGEQPTLLPGEIYQYTSACPLETSFGTMHGSYQMTGNGTESFNVKIAPFSLGQPLAIH